MEELVFEDRPGFFRRALALFSGRSRQVDDADGTEAFPAREVTPRTAPRYTITVRRNIVSDEDAVIAAAGFKRGEQQILNLSMTDAQTRQDIVQYLKGVSFALEGSWVEIGENMYVLVPATAFVEMAAATPRMSR
jgi:FtsZ-interacting cell division protein YlmF